MVEKFTGTENGIDPRSAQHHTQLPNQPPGEIMKKNDREYHNKIANLLTRVASLCLEDGKTREALLIYDFSEENFSTASTMDVSEFVEMLKSMSSKEKRKLFADTKEST